MKKLNIRLAADYLQRSQDFLRDEIKRRRIAFYKIGGRYYFSEKDLEDYIERGRVAAMGERRRKEAAK